MTTRPLAVQLAETLAAARHEQGRTMRAVAAGIPSTVRAGCSVSHSVLHELENAQANPTLARVEEIAAAYDIDLQLVATPRRPP